MKQKTTDLLKIILAAFFFALATYVTHLYYHEITMYLNFGYAGMVTYVLLGILATVIAPVSTLPLIPLATALWGGFVSAVLNIIAWTIGAIIAFIISRKYGKPFLSRYIDMKKIANYEKLLGGKYIFWNIVLLRMTTPVDVLSYAIGLFSSVRLSAYAGATFIGIIPFAFVFSYLPEMPLLSQVCVAIFVVLVVYLGYRKIKRL